MNVDKILAQHTLTPAQKRRMNSLRNCARMLAREIESATPAGPNQTLAIRHLALLRSRRRYGEGLFRLACEYDLEGIVSRVGTLIVGRLYPIESYLPEAYHCCATLPMPIGVEFLIQSITTPRRWIRMGD